MEKAFYLLQRPEGADQATFARELLEAGNQMAALDSGGVRLGVQDEYVDWGDAADHHAALGHHSYGPFDGVVQVWLDRADQAACAPFEALAHEVAAHVYGYLVEERVLKQNLLQSTAPGARNSGYSQVAFLQIPTRLTRAEWLKAWQDRHTWVALSIHPHLEYIQNVVIRPVTDGAPAIAGIGEEQFPIEGLHDERPLFPGGDTEERYDQLHEIMWEDAARFIDLDHLDMMVASQFDLRRPAW
jgi:hypothetical protein